MIHQLGRQITCGITVRSEANETLEVKAKVPTLKCLEGRSLDAKKTKKRKLTTLRI